MASATLVESTPTFFEGIYTQAAGERSQVPWDHGRVNPALVAWLNAIAPSLVRCGARVAVVGCGLGSDAAELVRRGYDVVAFDCSSTAIDWARRLHPTCSDVYVEADLFAIPTRWRHRFDLVVEINTIQALAPDRRGATATAIAALVSPRGRLLVIAHEAAESTVAADGPPWPLTRSELESTLAMAGLVVDLPVQCFTDERDVALMRGVFRRA